MKNEVICKICQSPNPFHQLICSNCKAILRDRVYNLDLWKTATNLVDNPKSTFIKIIFSEQKNFAFFILFFTSLKLYINSIFFFLTDKKNYITDLDFTVNYFVVLFTISLLFTFCAVIIKISNLILKNIIRLKDVFAVLSYASIPNAFALIILFPLELIFFGGYLFSNNPSPFIIKETTAFIFLTLELLTVLWTLFLSVIGIYTLTNNVLYSLIFGLGTFLTIYAVLYFLSVYFFN